MIFRGVATALITPFTNDGIDKKSFERLVDFQIDNGVDALVVLGTTGEPATMTKKEKAQIIEIALRKANGKIPIIVGAGTNSTQTAIEACKVAQDLGADALLVVTPYYNKCTQEGLVEHYKNIALSTSLPIICYNVQSRTGVNMLPTTFFRLAQAHKNIVGIKEASGNMEQIMQYINVCNTLDRVVYSGDDALTVACMAMGGMGVISVASNAYPNEVALMTHKMLAGELQEARQMQLAMLPVISSLFCEVNPIPIKTAMHHLGICSSKLRLPLTKMSVKNRNKLYKNMREFENHALYNSFEQR